MQGRFRILVIDDEPDVLRMLHMMLSAEKFEVLTAQDGLAGLRAAYEHRPDAVLLDIMMPAVDGFEVCQRLREITDVPILFVTAMNAVKDIVRGFSLGADDYIVKPFDAAELTSRLVASLRKASERDRDLADILFLSDSIILDCGRHELLIDDRSIYLTPKEFDVLRYLVRHAGKVLSTNAILLHVWGREYIGESELVKQYIYKLRRKLEPHPDSTQFLHTVRGSGYYFEVRDGVAGGEVYTEVTDA